MKEKEKRTKEREKELQSEGTRGSAYPFIAQSDHSCTNTYKIHKGPTSTVSLLLQPARMTTHTHTHKSYFVCFVLLD